jgi:hypothetical protein
VLPDNGNDISFLRYYWASTNWLSAKSVFRWRWVWSISGNSKLNYQHETLSWYHIVHHKCQMEWPGIQPGPRNNMSLYDLISCLTGFLLLCHNSPNWGQAASLLIILYHTQLGTHTHTHTHAHGRTPLKQFFWTAGPRSARDPPGIDN